ncbi:5-bromo-4-chloroindolyl phosphate hydrolysis family protein [Aestuariispira insulae]|uniref:5-bromo-4-chloroindolyl phosphate hydrolysis protein n=1 Tax=Aestuariispira insulae TaxID=1461337 RepID=A0A3D9H8L3_9PROT|nr:5-bromo-4-chloroindolyl phosphate hydrolysis family protein [Aestuariispira insulae]RED45809.1 5-bromo-4-chloroindolyl phosphate hydrolysis protein [Aestuariispira insulae]
MTDGLKDTVRVALAVTMAAVVGVVLYFATQLHEWVVIAAALAAFVVMILVVPKQREDHEVMIAPGVSLADQKKVTGEGGHILGRVRDAHDAIPVADEAHLRVAGIMDVLVSIYRHFNEDPAEILTTARFREQHVNKAVELVEVYSRLVTDPLLDESGRAYIDRCRERFAGIEAAFAAQYNAMLRHDVSALEQAGRNLETSLRLEHGLEKVAAKALRKEAVS